MLITTLVVSFCKERKITTHKGSQLLKLIETRYQVQPSDKELHTEHTLLRTTILH